MVGGMVKQNLKKGEKEMKKRTFLVLAVGTIVFSLLVGAMPALAPAQPKVIHWKGQNAYPAGTSQGYGIHLAQWLERISEGRLKVDIAPPGAIVPVGDMFDAVSKGVLDFAGNYFAGYYMGKFPEQDVEAGLPFAYTSIEDFWDLLYERGGFDIFQQVYAEKNIKWFPSTPNATYHVGTNSFELKSIRDLKGKKIRAVGTMADYLKALGASPVYLPAPEIYMASKLGTIDGCVFATDALDDFKLKEVWKSYIKDPNGSCLITNYLINMDSWKKLPADLQAKIQREQRYVDLEWTMHSSVLIRYSERKALRDYGVKPVFLPDNEKEEIMKIALSIWDKTAAKSARCAKLIDTLKAQARDLGRIK
jgi:TRAP-type mannitol/chloroaromatic compound transport system substrate-binding protein